MSINVVFIANVLCHHQVYISDVLYSRFGKSFHFIQMREPIERRVRLKMEGFQRDYCVNYFDKGKISEDSKKLLMEADAVIWGSTNYKSIKKYLRKDVLLLRYSERIFKPDYKKCSIFGKIKLNLSFKRLGYLSRHTNSYLLCASAFAYSDYLKFNAFKGRALKWGYFPKFDLNKNDKEYFRNGVVHLCWCSRLIDWKHPEYVNYLSDFLIRNHINHIIHVLGDGPMKNILNSSNPNIVLHGNVETDEVRKIYEESDIALFTSDFNEGWGAGVSEAMNHKCLAVVSDAMGCAPFIVQNNVNGKIFKHDDINEFCTCVLESILNKEKTIEYANDGYNTIFNYWRPEVAGNRLADFIISKKHGNRVFFEDGPLSNANILTNGWFVRDE